MTTRISTNNLYDSGIARLGELQSGLAKTQQQVSTGRRILSPSDDPVASARALGVANTQAVNSTYATNRRTANETLSATEGALGNVTSLLQDVKTLIVQAGNGGLDNTQRQYIATELQGRYEELLGLANSQDGVGNYIFAGYQSSTKPFAASVTGASYSGDQGTVQMQVHTARYLDVTQNGFDLFQNVASKGVFTSAAAAGNLGTATISAGSVVDATVLTGARYDITLTDDGLGGFNYSVDNIDDALPAVTTGTYQSGQPITFDGLEFSISSTPGAPQNGDVFTVRPVSHQSVFATMKSLITALQTPAGTANGNLKLGGSLSIANTNVTNALDHVLTARAAIGAAMKENESLDNLGADLNVQYSQALSNLQDLDLVEAITSLTKQQTGFEAAMAAFGKVTSLSLMNYLK